MGVVHDADEGPLAGRLGDQAEHGQPHQETVRGRPVAQPESRAQRPTLRPGQPVGPVQHRPAELVQPGECELHLRLDTHYPCHPEPAAARLLDHVLEQGRLAHTRFAAQDQRATLARPNGFQQPIERVAFAVPVT